MGKYSIKDLERLSGIKAHTIRIWEQRYNLLSPERTATNIRYYSDEQLKHLLNISLLVQHGIRISRISGFSENEFKERVSSLYHSPRETVADQEDISRINGLIVAMIELDEQKFNNIFASGLLKLGFEKNLYQVIFPFLEKVGLLWGLGQANPAQEHFISNLIRQKMISAIDGLEQPPENALTYVLFLREGELHEIGLLLASYLLKYHRFRVIYLGQNVPLQDLDEVVRLTRPFALLTLFTTALPGGSQPAYIQRLESNFKGSKILVAGGLKGIEPSQLGKDTHHFTSPQALVQFALKTN